MWNQKRKKVKKGGKKNKPLVLKSSWMVKQQRRVDLKQEESLEAVITVWWGFLVLSKVPTPARDRMWRKSPHQRNAIGYAMRLAPSREEKMRCYQVVHTSWHCHCNRVYCTEGLPYEKHACVCVCAPRILPQLCCCLWRGCVTVPSASRSRCRKVAMSPTACS